MERRPEILPPWVRQYIKVVSHVYLGEICEAVHEWGSPSKSLRYLSNHRRRASSNAVDR